MAQKIDAAADNVYGPYTYKGCFVVEDRSAKIIQNGVSPERVLKFIELCKKNGSY